MFKSFEVGESERQKFPFTLAPFFHLLLIAVLRAIHTDINHNSVLRWTFERFHQSSIKLTKVCYLLFWNIDTLLAFYLTEEVYKKNLQLTKDLQLTSE